jgi:hypothetical protein
MHKLTINHILGYSVIFGGILIAIVNYLFYSRTNATFGFIPFYIASGCVCAAGLTIVFRMKQKEEHVETDHN